MMTVEQATDLLRDAMLVTLLIIGPILAIGMVVGLVISVVQAVTQIQEATLAFVPKIFAMAIAPEGEIGVDVEVLRPDWNLEPVAAMYLDWPQTAQLETLRARMSLYQSGSPFRDSELMPRAVSPSGNTPTVPRL